MFSKYHYLNESLNSSAHCFIAVLNGVKVGFLAVIHFPHRNKYLKMAHRLVVLPDYQGIGIAKFILNNVGDYYLKQGFSFRLVTSSIAMKKALENSKAWKKYTSVTRPNAGVKETLNKTSSINRITFRFKYIGYEET